MSYSEFPLLSLIIILPIFGAIIIALNKLSKVAKYIALIVAIFEFIATLGVLYQFDTQSTNDFQLVECLSWMANLNIQYFIGVDGLAVLFLPATALLTILIIVACWNSVQHLTNLHFLLLLVLESMTMGVFVALDLVLFFLFWELTLPAIFFLTGLWGLGSGRRNAANKYTLFMLFGGVPLLLVIILLSVNHAVVHGGAITSQLSFSLPVLLKTPLADHLQLLVLFLLVLSFAVKAPLVPFHTWLPTIAMEGPCQLSAILTGLKLGLYGIIRFALPLAPAAAVQYSWVLGLLGAVTLIYSALIALQQTNLRRLLAYASISHVGLVLIGIASLTMQGIQGAVFQLLNFPIIAAPLMLMAGFVQHRLGSTELIHLGGLAKVAPKLTCLYFLFSLASIGIPGSSGFPAELLLIISTLLSHPGISIAALVGTILSAAYMLIFTRKAFWGATTQNTIQIHDLRTRELALLCVPALFVIVLGCLPNSLLMISQSSAEKWLNHLLTQSIILAGR